MFLYFNHQGELTTCIPHGEPPRQGNPLSVWVAVDKQYFKDKTPNTPAGWAVKVSVVYSETEATAPFPASYLGAKIFRKTNDSEITYDLIDGNSYYMYYCNIPTEYSTMQSGYKSLVTTFYTRKLLGNGQYSDDEITEYNNEAYDIYIEKTFGKAQDTSTVTKNQYNTLKNRLDVLSTGVQKRIVKQDTKVKSLLDAVNSFCAGDSVAILYNNALVQVLSVEENSGNMAIFCLLEDTVLKFEFNENDNVDEIVTPEEVELSGGGASGIILIDEILDEEEIKSLYESQESGKYSIKSEEFGDELIFINKDKELFKRFTAGYDYTFDFELNEWQVASGGGGAGGGNVVLTALSSIYKKVSIESEKIIKYSFRLPIGTDGTAIYYINEKVVKTENVKAKKEITFDASNLITKVGSYSVKVEVRDNNGNTGEFTFTFDVIDLVLTSTFVENDIQKSDFEIFIRANGNFEKTTHVFIDGDEKEEYSETFSENTKKIKINKLSHGVHVVKIFVTAKVDGGDEIESNFEEYYIFAVDDDNHEILIKSKFNKTVIENNTISIDYSIYNTQSENSSIEFLINGVTNKTLNVTNNRRDYWNVSNLDNGVYTFTIKTINSQKSFVVTVDYDIEPVQPIKTNLVLELDADGKSNLDEINRNIWQAKDEFNNVVATAVLDGFNWLTNGWMNVEGQKTYLHINGSATVDVPFKIFSESSNGNFITNGKTIEIDFSTSNVSNLDKVLVSSFADNIGFKIMPNDCFIKTNKRTIDVKFKENERVKVAFVIEQKGTDTRLIKTFINGVMSGLDRYDYTPKTETTDERYENFIQSFPVNLTINPIDDTTEETGGSDINIYSIRVYNAPLTDNQIVQNYISGLNLNEQNEKKIKNDIFDENGYVSFNKIEQNKLIPYLIFTGKKPTSTEVGELVDVDYYDPIKNGEFHYQNVEWFIQGTSSVNYPRKNWKGKFPEKFSFYDNAIPEDTYTFKADYMESSHSHNTGNAMFINTIAPKFPTQNDNPNVRNTIYGFPILIFWKENEDSTPEYEGVYNFNNDKGNAATIGLTTELAQSWEFRNHDSDRCNFLTDDFSDADAVAEDFKARYAKNKKDYSYLATVVKWVYDTRNDIQKFKNEFEQHFSLDACLFYYTMMDVMLAADSRSKNMFLDTVDGVIWYPRWYDMDTCYGLDNNGYNKFGYGLEQTDKFNESSYVYNGYKSALWNNFGTAFSEELRQYYLDLRRTGKLSYESMTKFLKEQQIDKISESMYNTDGQFKYVGPVIEKNDTTYLYVAQGSRLNHLQWWLSNRFRYLDSKYKDLSDTTDTIYMKVNGSGVGANQTDFKLTSFIDSYLYVRYGSKNRSARAKANEPTVVKFSNIGESFAGNDSEIFIHNASELLDIGDLSDKYPSPINLTNASKLKKIKLGSDKNGYVNNTTSEISLGENRTLESIDIQNCKALTTTLDLTNCHNIKEVLAKGSSITGVDFADGGNLEKLQLPSTIQELRLVSQPNLKNLEIEGYDNLTTIYLSGSLNINTKVILNAANNLNVVYVDGINWTLTNVEKNLIEKLYNINNCVLKGTIRLNSNIGQQKLNKWLSKPGWEKLSIVPNEITEDFTVTFYDKDKTTILKTVEVNEGEEAIYDGVLPSKNEIVDGYGYMFAGWSEDLTNVTKNLDVYPSFIYTKPTSIFWNLTDNTKKTIKFGISTSDKVKYRIKINWGDNSYDEYYYDTPSYTTREFTHEYNNTGLYNTIIEIISDKVEKNDSFVFYLYYSYCGGCVCGDVYFQDIITSMLASSGAGVTVNIDSLKTPKRAKTYSYDSRLYLINWKVKDSVYFNGTLDEWCSIDYGYGAYFFENGAKLYVVDSDVADDFVPVEEEIFIDTVNVGAYCLYGANFIKNIEFGPKVKNIGHYFAGTVQKLIFGENVQKTGDLSYNSAVLEIYYKKKLKQYLEMETAWQRARGTTYEDIYILDDNGEFFNITETADVIVPQGTTKIGNYCFASFNKLKTIQIPESVTSFGYMSFRYSSVQRIMFEEKSNLKTIEGYCFNNCTKLYNIELPSELEEINSYAFSDAALININIPKKVKSIGKNAFEDSELSSITFEPESELTVIDSYTFRATNLISIVIPKNVESIHSFAFENTRSLKNLEFEENSKIISIGESAFYNSGIENLVLPQSLKTISATAFSGCESLSGTLSIPKNLNYLGKFSFSSCTLLQTVNFSDECELDLIGASAFASCSNLTNINIDVLKYLSRINESAFSGCTSLQSIIFPENIIVIGKNLLKNCESLQNAKFKSSTPPSSVGATIFSGCSALTDVFVPNGSLTLYQTTTNLTEYASLMKEYTEEE